MITLIGVAFSLGLFGIVCARNFVVQMMSMKLIVDVLVALFVILKRRTGSTELEAVAWIWAGMGMVSLFLFVAVAAKQFAGKHSLKMEGDV